jgi:hypothetical protein
LSPVQVVWLIAARTVVTRDTSKESGWDLPIMLLLTDFRSVSGVNCGVFVTFP